MTEGDLSSELQGRIGDAARLGQPLHIVGSGTKDFYGRPVEGETLRVDGHRGIVGYVASELVLTARAGTPLAEIEATLAEQGQMLGFEPPHFGETATLGGSIACGFSGPRRPWAGAARDFVLGVRMLNGRGEDLRFGGEVMKNVAGFDLSRLMVGALGTLGVLLEVSLKVLPRPEVEVTRTFEMTESEALARACEWAGQRWPLSAVCFDGERLYVRLAGAEAAVRESVQALGGEAWSDADRFWADVREQRLAFFAGPEPLWRFSLAPASPSPDLPGQWFIDWGGAQRWLKTEAQANAVFAAAAVLGGHATLWRTPEAVERPFQPLPERLRQLHTRLKQAFDPYGILNAGRMCAEW